jgi:hypothetical protein
MPIRFGWIIAAAVAAVLAHAGRPVLAEPSDAVAAADCQDRFRLDRRDNPENAIKNFHQCTAIQSVSLTLENFTFWYVTLPDKGHLADDSWFAKVYKDDAAILASPAVALNHQQAAAVLDDSIIRGLRRGKRDDLGSKWLASHNPQIFTTGSAAPPSEAPKATSIAATEAPPTKNPATAAPPSTTTDPPAAQHKIAEVLPPKPAEAPPPSEPPKRVSHHFRPRQSHAAPNGGFAAGAQSSADLNRAEPPGGWYTPVVPATIPRAFYPANVVPPPPYYATVLRPPAPYPPPASYPAPAAVTYAPPPRPAPPPQPAAVSAPPPTALPQPQYAQPASTAATPPAQPQVRTIGEQIDFNLRTITGLINSNIATIQQTIFGPPPTYYAR